MKIHYVSGIISVVALALTALLPDSQPMAQDGYTWVYRPHNRTTNHAQRYKPRVYGYQRRHDDDHGRHDGGSECKPSLARAGSEAFDEDNAREKADLAWQEEVRFLWGERFMDVSNARRVTYECSRSSTNESWIGKAGERIAGDNAVKKRCRITALPCRGDADKRADR